MQCENKSQSVIVVTIRETVPTCCDEVDTVVFSDWEKANAWIESQIESQVQTFGLDRESAVDGRFVTIDSSGHTIEYEAKERVVK